MHLPKASRRSANTHPPTQRLQHPPGPVPCPSTLRPLSSPESSAIPPSSPRPRPAPAWPSTSPARSAALQQTSSSEHTTSARHYLSHFPRENTALPPFPIEVPKSSAL